MKRTCKLCGQEIDVLYTIASIPYYHCPHCNFLQNFYWDDQPQAKSKQIIVNQERRDQRWPAGEADYMHTIGWGYLEAMVWPIAWHSRKAHNLLKYFPGYTPFVKQFVKKRLHRILDFGCGHGITALELRRRDGFDAYGLDPFSPTNDPSIIRQEVFEKHFPDNHFDGIFSIETMEHIPNILPIFTEMRRILKPGGVLLVQTNRLEHPKYQEQKEKWFYLEHPQTHVSIYSEPAMRRIAKKTGWASVEFHGPRLARFTK